MLVTVRGTVVTVARAPEPTRQSTEETRTRRAAVASLFRGGQQLRGHPPRAVPDGASGAGDGDGSSRDRVDVDAYPESITHAFSLELRGELRCLDGEIAVRLMMLNHDDAGEHPVRVHAHEHFDRAVVPSLERL